MEMAYLGKLIPELLHLSAFLNTHLERAALIRNGDKPFQVYLGAEADSIAPEAASSSVVPDRVGKPETILQTSGIKYPINGFLVRSCHYPIFVTVAA